MSSILFIHSVGMCKMRRFLAVLRSFFHSSLSVLFSVTFPHHLFFTPLSPHLVICFLVYLNLILFINSYLLFNHHTNKCTYIKFHFKTLKIAPTCFDRKIIFRELHCSLLKSHFKNTHLLISIYIQGAVAACL